MCYSATMSLGTFILVTSISTFLVYRNHGIDRPVGLMLTVIALMQLVEYILWKTPECNNVNNIATGFVGLLLFLQPPLLAWIVWLYKAGRGLHYTTIIIVYICALPILIYTPFDKCILKGAEQTNTEHLKWYIPNVAHSSALNKLFGIAYYIPMFYIFASLNNPRLSIVFLTFYSISWVLTNIWYNRAWGSVWCHAVNSMALVAPFL